MYLQNYQVTHMLPYFTIKQWLSTIYTYRCSLYWNYRNIL